MEQCNRSTDLINRIEELVDSFTPVNGGSLALGQYAQEGGGDASCLPSKSKEAGEKVNKEDKANGDIGIGEGKINDNLEGMKYVSGSESGDKSEIDLVLESQKDGDNANIEPYDFDNDISYVADDSNLIELISEKREDESISEILELSLDHNKGKRKREDTDETEKLEENEPSVKKGPKSNEKLGSVKEIDLTEEEDEDGISLDSDENSKDNNNSLDYKKINYLTKQLYVGQWLMTQDTKKQAMETNKKPKGDSGDPIDLTEEEESGEDRFVDSDDSVDNDVEELDSSELDTEAEAESDDYDSDSSLNSVDERQWKIVYDQLIKLRNQGHSPQSSDPASSEGLISIYVLDLSDEDVESPEELENENKNEQQSSEGLEASSIGEKIIEKGDDKETSDGCEEKSSEDSCENYLKSSNLVEPEGKKNTEENGVGDSVMKSMEENRPTIDENSGNEDQPQETEMSEELYSL